MQAELHRHLDVSIRPQTFLRLAQERNLESQSTSLDAFKNKITLRQPLSDLKSVLALFEECQKVLNTPEALERVAFEALEDCWLEGTRKVEFRYSPLFVSRYSSLTWQESLASLQKGLNQALYRYPGMKAGLICIASRDHGPEKVDEVMEFFLKNMDQFIGIDLAGNEVSYPCRLYEASFKKAKERGARITIHAGEATGPENIWEAIELLGAKRIGHGVASIKDPELMAYLIKRQICLEMCPTSNWLTQAVPSHSQHPLPLLLRAGVPVTVNTDDPGIFGVSLTHEFRLCREQMGITLKEVELLQHYANVHSFLR